MDRAIEKETNILQVLLNKVNTFNYYTDNTQSQILKTVEAVERTNECFSIEGANWLYHKAKQQGIKCRCFLGILIDQRSIEGRTVEELIDEHAFIVLGDATLLEVDYTDWFGIHQYQSFNDLITDTVRQMYKHSLFGTFIYSLKGIWEYTPQDTAINIMDFYTELFKNKPLYTEQDFEGLMQKIVTLMDTETIYGEPKSKWAHGILRCEEPRFTVRKPCRRIYIRYRVTDAGYFGNGEHYIATINHPAYFRVYSKRYELLGFLNMTGPRPTQLEDIVEYRKCSNFNLERYYEDIMLWAKGTRTLEVWNTQEGKYIPTIISEWDHWKERALIEHKSYIRAMISCMKNHSKRYELYRIRKKQELQIHSKAYRLRSKRELDNP